MSCVAFWLCDAVTRCEVVLGFFYFAVLPEIAVNACAAVNRCAFNAVWAGAAVYKGIAVARVAFCIGFVLLSGAPSQLSAKRGGVVVVWVFLAV